MGENTDVVETFNILDMIYRLVIIILTFMFIHFALIKPIENKTIFSHGDGGSIKKTG